MNDSRKTKAQLIEELAALRQRVHELEHPPPVARVGTQPAGPAATAEAAENAQEVTERKKLEQSLRESEERLRAVVASLYETAIVVYDREGTLTSLWGTRELDERYGIRAAEATGKRLAELLPADQAAQRLATVQKVFDTGEGLVEEQAFDCPGGHFWQETSYAPLRTPSGEVSAVVSFIRDTTERRAMEERLRASERRYRAIVEDQTELICRWLPGGEQTFVNDAYCRCFGKSRDELVGRNLMSLIPEEDREEALEHFSSLSREHPVATHEHRVVARNGEVRHHQWTDRAIFDAEGNLVEYQSVGRDVTEHRRMEAALRSGEERFRTVVDASKDAMIAIGEDGLVTLFNSAAESMFGRPAAEVLGQALAPLMPEEFRGPHQHYVDSYFIHGKPDGAIGKTIELTAERSDGQQFPVELSLSIGQHEGQRFALAVIRDITARKQVEEELRRAHEELERRVKDRTAALGAANRQLVQQIAERRKAEDALREREETLRDLFENANDLIVSVSPEGNLVYANRAWREGLGYSEAEIADLSFFDVVHPDSRAHCTGTFREVLERGAVSNTEAVFLSKDGRSIIVEGNCNCRFKDGQPTAIRGIFRDMTERKRAEKLLQTTKDRLEYLLASASVAVYTAKTSGDYGATSITENVQELVGYEPDEFIEDSAFWIGHVHPEDRERILKELPQLFEQGSHTYEYRFRHKDGTHRWIRDDMRLTKDEDGNAVEIVGCWIDITERKRAEEALRESEERYRTLFNDVPIGVYRTTPDGRIDSANPALVRMLGYSSAEELADRNLETVGFEPEYPRRDYRARMERNGAIAGMEAAWTTQNGAVLFVREHAKAIRDAQGRIIYYEGTAEDVTDRKAAEEALHHRIEFDELITAISTRFINLPTDAVDEGIDHALRQIGEFVGADRSYAFRYSADGSTMSNTHEWCAPGIAEMRHRLQELPTDVLSWFSEQMERWDTVHVPSVADLPPEAAAEKEEWEAESIQSLICVPMGCEGELLGFVGFDSVGVAKSWPEEIVALLRIVGEIFANALVRKRVHEALHASEQKYRSLIENIPAAVWTTDQHGNTLFMSPNVERITGYTPEEVYQTGPHLSAGRIHPDDAEDVERAFKQLFAEQKTFDVEYRFRRKDGEWIWVHDRAVSTYVKDGVPCTDGVVSDITARKRAEAALRRSEQRFRALVETTSDWVWETDQSGRYTYASPRIKDLCGYAPEEMIGKSAYDLMAAQEAERVGRLFKRIVERRQPFSGLENTVLRKDGGQVVLERSGVPIIDERGELLGYRGIDRDITGRKRAEEALLRSEKLAAMGTTVAGVAHELNNPLTSICGLSELLTKDESLGPQARSLATEIAEQGRRCSNIVDNLLGFARERRGIRRSVSINTLLENCLWLTRHDPKFEGVEIETDYSPTLPTVTADPYQLEQVFINIITNALDALQEASAERLLKIRTTRDRGEVYVEFADTGPGIDEPGKVFDPFYTTKTTGSGTGLGLSVSYGIVEEHGGHITASNLDKGACFTVRLPIGPQVATESGSQQANEPYEG